jgi:hypothetical protein
MSASARRFFGCLLPAVFLVFGCGACALLGYAGQAFVQFETIRAADMGYPFQKGWTAISNSTARWGLNPSAGNIVTVVRPAGLAIRRVVGVPGESVAVRAGRFLVYNPDPKRQHRPTDTADPKVTLRIDDGLAFVRSATAYFDLIVLDLTDPGGPSTPLYTADFYRSCAARLHPQGAMALHVGSPVGQAARISEGIGRLREAFPVVTPYLASIPLYGGLWMMACVSPSLDPRTLSVREVDRRIAQRGLADLRYCNGDTYRAALALPNFVRELLAAQASRCCAAVPLKSPVATPRSG